MERIDDLERSGLKIIQDDEKFCFGMDAVLLSGFIKAKAKEKVLDLGSGTGIIPILLTAKTEADKFYGLEIQKDMADMAARSVALNNLQEKVQIIEGDIKKAVDIFGPAAFDVVCSNPPYMNDMHGIKNPKEPLAIARHEVKCSLHDVLSQSAKLLKTGGRFYMVHRPHRLEDIMSELRQLKLEPKRMRFVHPYKDKEANMVLIEAVKNGGSFLKVEAPLIIYKDVNVYTEELLTIYGY